MRARMFERFGCGRCVWGLPKGHRKLACGLLLGGALAGPLLFAGEPAWGLADETTQTDNSGATDGSGSVTGQSPFDADDPIQPRFAESMPMVQVLRAIRDQDLKRFRDAFTQRVQGTVPNDADWTKGMRYYTHRITEFCGREQDLADITFVFDPDPQAENESSGQLTVVFRGRRRFVVRVRSENHAWKIDEK